MGLFRTDQCFRYSLVLFLFLYFSFSVSVLNVVDGKRQPIEEIAKRQLDSLLQTEDYLAVFWRKKVSLKCSVRVKSNYFLTRNKI